MNYKERKVQLPNLLTYFRLYIWCTNKYIIPRLTRGRFSDRGLDGENFVTWLSCRILVNFKFKKLVASNDPKFKSYYD